MPLFGELRLRLRLLLPTALVVLLLRVLLVVQVVLVVLVELAILGVPLVQLDVSEEDVSAQPEPRSRLCKMLRMSDATGAQSEPKVTPPCLGYH